MTLPYSMRLPLNLNGDYMIDLITFPRIIVCVSCVGVVLVNHYKNRWGFIAFGLSSALWAVYDFDIGATEQAVTNIVSTLISIYGFVRWKEVESK